MKNFVGPDIDVRLEERKVVAHQVKDWEIILEYDALGGKKTEVMLSDRTAAAIVFLHDLLALRRMRGIVGESLMKRLLPDLKWAYAKWDLGAAGVVKAKWLTPPWLSFWQCDFLRRGWNDTWMWMRNVEPTLRENKVLFTNHGVVAYLAYTWIKIGTIIISADKDSMCSKMNLPTVKEIKEKMGAVKETQDFKDILKSAPDDHIEKLLKMTQDLEKWLKLVSDLSEMSKRHGLSAVKRELIHGWLARIACILAPESGIPSSISSLFFSKKGDKLLTFWMKPDIAREIRQIRAETAAQFYKKGSHGEVNKLFSPKKQEDLIEKEKNIPRNEVDLYWLATHEIRHNAMNIFGNETLCPAIEDIKRLAGGNGKPWKEEPIPYRKIFEKALFENRTGNKGGESS